MEQHQSVDDRSFLNKVGSTVEHAQQTLFYRLGLFVGSYPAFTFLVSLLVTAALMSGVVRFHQENRPEELWIPTNTDTIDNFHLAYYYFPETARSSYLIVTTSEDKGNVLTPTVMRKLYDIHESLLNIATVDGQGQFYEKYNITWDHYCFRRDPRHCWISSILTLWEFDKDRIYNLKATNQTNDIVTKLNEANLNDPWNGGLFQIKQHVSGIEYSPTDKTEIVKAKALHLVYRVFANDTFDKTRGEYVDKRADEFEKEVEKIGLAEYSGIHTFVNTLNGLIEESTKAASNDFIMLAAGAFLFIIYLCLSLGQLSRLKHKLWLSIGGVLSIGFAIAVSISLSSAFGYFYGPVHIVLPYLLLGIGVDDIYVILSCYNNLPEKVHKEKSVGERIGLTLKEAGVSVAVSSLTDMAAFLVGGFTVLPGLKSFSIFAGMGVLFSLIYQVTFFAALLAVDAMRIDDNRDACLGCKLSENYQESKCYWTWWPFQTGWLNRFMGNVYAKILMKLPVKIVVIVFAMVLFAVSTYGVTLLKREFSYNWFLPPGSYVLDYYDKEDMYFPTVASTVGVYTGYVGFFESEALNHLGREVTNNPYIDASTVDYWYYGYEEWMAKHNFPWPSNDWYFMGNVSLYLNSPDGMRHQKDVFLDHQNYIVGATRLVVNYIKLNNTDDKVDAMVSLRKTAASVQLYHGTAFAYADSFLDLDGDLVIRNELYRNLGLAMVCVFVITLLLMANIWSSLLILCSVILTLVNTAGMMHFLGVTIDVFSGMILVMSIGFAVNYSAHIVRDFLIPNESAKTSNERAILTLRTTGSAVLNGGITTLLAFILLGLSQSYTFSVLFKVVLLVVCFGLFNSLDLLPVVLSFIGCSPYGYSLLDDHKVSTKKASKGNGYPSTESGDQKDTKHPEQNGHDGYENNLFAVVTDDKSDDIVEVEMVVV